MAINLSPNELWVRVKHRHNSKTSCAKSRVLNQGSSNSARTNNDDVSASVDTKRSTQSIDERREAIANARATSNTKVAEVSPNLSIIEREQCREFAR
jgi:hypothetical protein